MNRMEASYYFPLSFLVPDFDADLRSGPYEVVRRKWRTSIFDLATLATRHDLHLPYQVMDVLLSQCNMELAVHKAASLEEAKSRLDCFRIGAYIAGVSPFISPFVTTRSINEYSGINGRDSALQQGREQAVSGDFSSSAERLSAWPVQLSFTCITEPKALNFSNEKFFDASRAAEIWWEISKKTQAARALTNAFLSAPLLPSAGQSLLHIWTAIESLFPTVNTEVSFRLSLYITVLCAHPRERSTFHNKVKKAYSLRSGVAHGSKLEVSMECWTEAWDLLCACAAAIAKRRSVPTEMELLEELFGAGS